MMPQPAILSVYSPWNWSISDLDNFTSVLHANHGELIWKSPKKFGWLVTNPRYSPYIALGHLRNYKLRAGSQFYGLGPRNMGPMLPFVDFTIGLKSKLKFKVWVLNLGGVFSWVEAHKIFWESTVPLVWFKFSTLWTWTLVQHPWVENFALDQ